MDRRVRVALFCCGLACILGSLVLGGVDGSRQQLSQEKAKEIQQARRQYHSLSHQYAHHATGKSSGITSQGELADFDKSKLLEAEQEFKRLEKEVEAIRNSRPWLTSLLRYGGLFLCLAAGLASILNSKRPKPTLDSKSASSISAYEMEIRRRS